MKKTKAELQSISGVTTNIDVVTDQINPEEESWLYKLENEFGAEVLFKAQKLVRGWKKMTARQQYEFLREAKDSASYDPT